MTWPKIVLLALYATSALSSVAFVGKPRKPTTSGSAVAAVVISGLMCWPVVIA